MPTTKIQPYVIRGSKPHSVVGARTRCRHLALAQNGCSLRTMYQETAAESLRDTFKVPMSDKCIVNAVLKLLLIHLSDFSETDLSWRPRCCRSALWAVAGLVGP